MLVNKNMVQYMTLTANKLMGALVIENIFEDEKHKLDNICVDGLTSLLRETIYGDKNYAKNKIKCAKDNLKKMCVVTFFTKNNNEYIVYDLKNLDDDDVIDDICYLIDSKINWVA